MEAGALEDKVDMARVDMEADMEAGMEEEDTEADMEEGMGKEAVADMVQTVAEAGMEVEGVDIMEADTEAVTTIKEDMEEGTETREEAKEENKEVNGTCRWAKCRAVPHLKDATGVARHITREGSALVTGGLDMTK